jgi:very-short-patch-repair endonuclease
MEKANPSNNFYYNKDLNPLAKELKKQMTKSEACMWKYLLQAKQFYGYSFRRQRPILNYIVDFCCLELMLIIEVDGITHDSELSIAKDISRDAKLCEIGFTVHRFSSWEVLNRLVDVDIILTNCLPVSYIKLRCQAGMLEKNTMREMNTPPPTPSKACLSGRQGGN